jgi:hypothetical protein
MANYVCHSNDRPTQGCGTMVLVRRGNDHYSVPVSKLSQASQTSGGLSTTSAIPGRCSGETLVLLAGDLNAKHKDWNSRLNLPR